MPRGPWLDPPLELIGSCHVSHSLVSRLLHRNKEPSSSNEELVTFPGESEQLKHLLCLFHGSANAGWLFPHAR